MNTPFNLSENALLVKIKIGCWTGQRQSPQLQKEAAEKHAASKDSITAGINLIPKKRLKRVSSMAEALRNEFKRSTLLWEEEGWRMTPAERFPKLRDLVTVASGKYNEAVKTDLLDKHEEIKAEAKIKLNGLFDELQFPSIEDLKEAFYVSFATDIISRVSDMRVFGIDPVDAAKMQVEIETRYAAQLKNSQTELIARLEEVVKLVTERLGNVDQRFHKALVENVQKLCVVTKELNVTKNPELDKLVDAIISKFEKIDIDTVRTDNEYRVKMAGETKSILEDLQHFKG